MNDAGKNMFGSFALLRMMVGMTALDPFAVSEKVVAVIVRVSATVIEAGVPSVRTS